MRAVKIEKHPTAAAGGVVIAMGKTRVLCTASIAKDVPRWLLDKSGQAQRGWVTAEYSMLPGSTPDRKRRGPDGRGTEIQRLIGRSLRAGVDLSKMPGVAVTCDCDVLVADGGTRTAAITGAWVALSQALGVAKRRGLITKNPIRGLVAAVSVGVVDGVVRLDLDYELDVCAQVDMNVVMDHRGRYIEVQGTGEQRSYTRGELDKMLKLAAGGVKKLVRVQRRAIKG